MSKLFLIVLFILPGGFVLVPALLLLRRRFQRASKTRLSIVPPAGIRRSIAPLPPLQATSALPTVRPFASHA